MQDTPGRRLYLSTAVDSESNFLDRRGRRRRRDRERRNGGGNKRKRKGMPSHRGLSSPTKEDYRICLLVDHHRCRSLLALLPPSVFLSFGPPPLPSSVPARPGPRLFQFLSPERNAMATLRGTKFRRKFLRKSPLSPVALFNPTHVSILGREVSPPARRCPFRSGPRHSGRECFYYRGST